MGRGIKGLAMASKPHWRINKEALQVEIVIDDKVRKFWALPNVCTKYTGEARDYVVADEAEKIRKEHMKEFMSMAYAWAVVQELTPNDKAYLRYHKLWLVSCETHGERDAASRALYRELERRSAGLTPAGNVAVNTFNKSRSHKAPVGAQA